MLDPHRPTHRSPGIPSARFSSALRRIRPLAGESAARGLHLALCPFCNRKPAAGVLRQQGDGGRRSLLCGFCLTEWEFRRVICPGCGQEDHAKLPVYTADELALHPRRVLRRLPAPTSNPSTSPKTASPTRWSTNSPLFRSTSGRRSTDTPNSIPTCLECDCQVTIAPCPARDLVTFLSPYNLPP